MADATTKIALDSRITGDGPSAFTEYKAAEYLVDALGEAGVRHLFGVVGGTVFPIFTATVGRQVQIVMAKHETGAAFMADGYARASGGLGCVRGDVGTRRHQPPHGSRRRVRRFDPDRRADGAGRNEVLRRGALQESSSEGVDIVDVFKQVTRYSILTFRADRLPAIWHKALRMATGGRPGPVHLSLPADVQEQEVQRPVKTSPMVHQARTYDRDAIKQAALHLLRARRPVILAGHGAILSNASDEIRVIAEMLDIPVATTPKGKGVFPEDHRLSVGPFGYSGSPLAQWHLLESGMDVLLAIGTSLGEWGTLGWDRRLQPSGALLHIDIDPYEVGKNYQATVPLIGDAKSGLTELAYELRRQQQRYLHFRRGNGKLAPPPDRPRYLNAAAMESSSSPIKPQRLLRDLQDALPRDALVFVDGGANRSWAIHYWQSLYPRTFFCATGMASMGFGVAGAIGGKFAVPDRVVISITGDGGFLMNGMEVSTAVHYNKQVIWVVMNDAGYGMIHHAFRMMKRPDVGTRFPRVDCARVAEGLGAQAFRIREPGQISRELIERIIESGRPTVLDVEIDSTEVAPFGGRVETLGNYFGT